MACSWHNVEWNIHIYTRTCVCTYIYIYMCTYMAQCHPAWTHQGRGVELNLLRDEWWLEYVELHIFPSYLSGFSFQTLKINLITLTTEFAKPVDIWGPISKPPSCSVRWTGLRRCSLFNSPGSWCLEGPGGTKVLEVAPWVLGPGLWPSP